MRGRALALGGCIAAALLAMLAGLALAEPPPDPAQMQVEPDPLLSLGSVCVGKSSVKSFTISNVANSGAEDLTVSSITRSGSSAFIPSSVTSMPPIHATESASFAVTFTPSSRTSYSATYSFQSNVGTQTRQVSGSGKERKLAADRSSVTFGEQRVGTRSATQNLTLRNPGLDAVTITSVKRIGANGGDFRSTPPASSFTISPGGAAVVALAFQPTGPGLRSGSLEILYSNQWCPVAKLVVGLFGTGVVPNIVVEPNPIELGSSAIGTESKPVSVTLTNEGKAPLKITAVQVVGTDAADFFLKSLPAMPVTVFPAGSLTFDVTMTPSAEGLRSATINIVSDDPDTPAFTVPVRGTAGTAAPSARPSVTRSPSVSPTPSHRASSSASPNAIAKPSNDSLALGMVIGGVALAFGGLLFIRRLVAADDED
jgi:hypothetical protein